VRGVALLVTAILLQAGCSAASSDPPLQASLSPVDARPSPAGPRLAGGVKPAASLSPEELRLIPLECRYADLRIGAGPLTDATTGERSMVFEVRNVGSTPCALFGYPRLRLLAKDGDLRPSISYTVRRTRVVVSRRSRSSGPGGRRTSRSASTGVI
jgi:hypothetical protein